MWGSVFSLKLTKLLYGIYPRSLVVNSLYGLSAELLFLYIKAEMALESFALAAVT